jgi:colanic acid biosynthesis glycosyl transferase WcaI
MQMKKDAGGFWRLFAPLTFALSASPVVISRIFRFRPTSILCVEPTLFSAPAALFAGKLIGAKMVLHVQDLEVDAAFGVGHIRGRVVRRCAAALEGLLLSLFDRVVTISEKMRDALLAKGLKDEKLSVLRNWVDLRAISPRKRSERNRFRDRLRIRDDEFVVLYAGHIGVKQALDVMLDAARHLSDEPNIRFVIAGAGPARKGLMAAYADVGNLDYLPLQPASLLAELLGMADLHMLPQHRGAADLVLPSKLGGMLASGRPIVATVEPGTELSNILQDIALLTPAGDSAALADAIRAARRQDLSGRVSSGLLLAESLSSEKLLPFFERLLVSGHEEGSGVDAPHEAVGQG